jgi:ATP-dependent helicase/nuclease subunit A
MSGRPDILWIGAGAGSGKTERLVNEIVGLLRGVTPDGVPLPRSYKPCEILALTFTRAATLELRQRVRLKLLEAGPEGEDGPPGRLYLSQLDDLSILNFHGFAAQLLGEEAIRRGWGCGITVLDSAVAAERDRRLLDRFLTAQMAKHPADWSGAEKFMGMGALQAWLNHAADRAAIFAPQFTKMLARLPGRAAERDARRREASAQVLPGLREGIKEWQPQLDPALLRAVERVADYLAAIASGRAPPDPGLLLAAKQAFMGMDKGGLWGNLVQSRVRKTAEPAFEAAQAIALEAALEPLLPELGLLLESSRQFAARQGSLSFDDLMSFMAEALGDEALCRSLAGRYKCLLVDEAQDTDPVQARLVRAFHKYLPEDGRIVVVGDEKQAIFRFRSADLESYFALQEQLEGARTERLEKNFRSVVPILDAVQELGRLGLFEAEADEDEEAPPPFWVDEKARLVPERLCGDPARLFMVEGGVPEYLDWALAKLAEWKLERRDALFLAATGKQLDELEAEFIRRDIPVIRPGQSLWDRECAVALCSAAAAAADPENDVALLAALRSILFTISDDDLIAAVITPDEKPGRLRALWENPPGSGPLAEAMARLRELRECALPPAIGLEALARACGLEPLLEAREFPGGFAERQAFDRLMQLAAGCASLSEFAVRCRKLRAANERQSQFVDPSLPGVRLMTVHGAKGLGERAVFLDGRLSLKKSQKSDQLAFHATGEWAGFWGNRQRGTLSWEDEGFAAREAEAAARDTGALAYVALTRAKDYLTIWAPDFSSNRGAPLIRRIDMQRDGSPLLQEKILRISLEEKPPVEIRLEPLGEPPLPVPLAAAAPVELFSPEDYSRQLGVMGRGSLLHKTMELWTGFAPGGWREALARAARTLGAEAEEKKLGPVISKLDGSPLLQALRAADQRGGLWREFTLFVPGEIERDEESPEADDYENFRLFRRGVADLVYRDESGRWVIVDYKTGKRTAELEEEYRAQLAGYRAALQSAGCPDAKMVLWFVEQADGVVTL